MKKFFVALFAFCFMLFPLAGCGKKSDDGLKTVRVSEVTHSVFYAPMYIADAMGYFKEEGLKIELTNAGGADNVMASVISNSADIGFCGPEAAMYVHISGSNDLPMVFGTLTKRDGSFLVSRKNEKENFTLENLRGKEVLAGRRGGVPAMTFEYLLKTKHNMIDKVDYTMNYDVNFSYMTAAFEGGTADYCTMFEPVASEFEKQGKGYVVASVGQEAGEVPYTAYIAKNSYINKNPQVIEGFLRAVMKGIHYVNNNDSKLVAEKLVPYFNGTSLDSLNTSVANYKKIDAWQTNMIATQEAYQNLINIMDNAGELAKKIDYNALMKTDIAASVYNKLFA